MFGRRRGHKDSVDYVEPDLPITPMLDMSFQLLAFFIMTFQPMPTEGQILLALPKVDGGQSDKVPDLSSEKPVQITIRVTATQGDAGNKVKGGAILNIYLEEKKDNAPPGINFGNDSSRYFKDLQARIKADKEANPGTDRKPGMLPKLSMELDPKLLHVNVLKLLDEAVRAGFTDISTQPLEQKKISADPK